MAKLIESKPEPTTTITIRVSTSTEHKWKACVALAKKVRGDLFHAVDATIDKFCDKAIEEMSGTWDLREPAVTHINGKGDEA